MSFRLFSLLIAFAVISKGLWAATPDLLSMDFTAPLIKPDPKTGEMVASGGVRLVYKETVLQADEMRHNRKTGVVVARGNATIQRAAYRLLAREITYNLNDESFSVKDLRFGTDPINISGSSVTGNSAEVTIRDAVATFREPGLWTPTIKADSLTFRVDKSISVDGGRIGAGRLQPLPLPGFPIPVDQLFLKYVTFAAGYHAYLGAFLEFGLRLPVYPGINAGADVGYYSNRGVMLGPSGEYSRTSGEHHVSGRFQTGFIHDSGDKLRDILGDRINEDRGFITWEHRQRFNDRLSLTAEVRYWSDSEIMRDFRPKEFFPYQQPDTFVEANYVGDNVIVSGFVRPKFNRYFLVQERLPEFQVHLLPQRIGSADLGLYQRGHVSLARLVEDAPAFGPTLKSDRADAYYALTRPFTPREWLTVQPVVGAELTRYDRTREGSGRGAYNRALGEFGADAELHASATFPYQNEAWQIDGLRHLITPRLSYRYIPKADRGRQYIPPIDQRDFSTYLQPLGLGDRRAVDDITPTNTLRLQLDNTLQTRDKIYGSRNLVRLDLAADVRFDRESSERTLSDLHTALSITPVTWLSFDLYQRFSLHDGEFHELNTGLTITNSEWWSLRLGTHYLAGDIAEFVADGSYRFNEVFEGFGRLHFDARRSRFVQQTYGVRQTLDNVWTIGYGVNFYEGRSRESSFGFFVQIEAVRF